MSGPGGGGLSGYHGLLMGLRDCSILNGCAYVHGMRVGWREVWQRKFLQQPERKNDLKVSFNLVHECGNLICDQIHGVNAG